MLYYLLLNILFVRDLPFLAVKLYFVLYITLCIHDLMYNVYRQSLYVVILPATFKSIYTILDTHICTVIR
jgi:hypothetical protein